MRTFAAIGAACVIAGWAAIHAQPTPQQNFETLPFAPRRAICYRTPAALQIDGRLSEGAWKAAPWSDPFVDIDGTRRPPLGTRMKMLWDDDHFYIGAELEEPGLWGTLKARDSVIFQADRR